MQFTYNIRSILTDPNYKIEHRQSSNLDDKTKNNIDDRSYILCGIINYVSYRRNKSTINRRNDHYVVITYTGIHWSEYLMTLKELELYVAQENSHVIIYVIKP